MFHKTVHKIFVSFITANHIKVLDNPTGVLLGGSSYSIDPNSWMRLQNSMGGGVDLIMFRVVGANVGLAGLTGRTSEKNWNNVWAAGY